MAKRQSKSKFTPKWHSSPSARRGINKGRKKNKGWEDPRKRRPETPDWLGDPVDDEDYCEDIRFEDADEGLPREED